MKIEMVDLNNQYLKIKSEIDNSILTTVNKSLFINGPEVSLFENNLSDFLEGAFVISCANGTDALQIALMALNLKPGDEIILPAFTYVATAEVVGLLQLKPVMVDVDPYNFNITIDSIRSAITPKSKVIVPVHLFGQCADMEPIMNLANEFGLYVVEDAAQALGASYTFTDGTIKKAGTIGHIGCTSFFPSKNLGCFGDGGAMFTTNFEIANRLRIISNHGQVEKYVHKYIGVNSRLDSLQAGILNVKLQYLNSYCNARCSAAEKYDSFLCGIDGLILPKRQMNSTHVFHQYTLKVIGGRRDALKKFLFQAGIPSMVYYPIPLNDQEAYQAIGRVVGDLSITQDLCASVLSIPMHTELKDEQINFITDTIIEFFK
ncbi:DegT/DnrJ/EryC1/StrS family aminotransferase [Polaribacter sp.]|uniref:DegT/DnrJ/EryC1/StrS family aminotransferase n=1 Tax=Polaribacter sp. TaxID=1920175 RepID=UPI004048ACB1